MLAQASAPIDPSFPWAELIVAIVGGLVGSAVGAAIGMLASLWAASKSEAYRKLSSWEPYATTLWEKRLDYFLQISERLIHIDDLTTATARTMLQMVGPFDAKRYDELTKEYSRLWDESQAALDSAYTHCRIHAVISPTNLLTEIVDTLDAITELHRSFGDILQQLQGQRTPSVELAREIQPELEKLVAGVHAEIREALGVMSNTLKVIHLDWAEVERFEAIARKLQPETMRRLMSEIIIKGPKSIDS